VAFSFGVRSWLGVSARTAEDEFRRLSRQHHRPGPGGVSIGTTTSRLPGR
jgi:hypothetical protein